MPPAPCATPCIGICRLMPHSDLCEGCLRTLGEIAEWGAATNRRRREILAAVDSRRPSAAVTGHKAGAGGGPVRGS